MPLDRPRPIMNADIGVLDESSYCRLYFVCVLMGGQIPRFQTAAGSSLRDVVTPAVGVYQLLYVFVQRYCVLQVVTQRRYRIHTCLHCLSHMLSHKVSIRSRRWMDGWMDGWMDVWMDGWMDGWMD